MLERWRYVIKCVIYFLLLLFSSMMLQESIDFLKIDISKDVIQFIQWSCFIALSLWQASKFVQMKSGEKTNEISHDNSGNKHISIKQILLENGKSKEVVYIHPKEYAHPSTARCRLASRLSHWRNCWWKKSSDVIVLYSARSSGKREAVCRAIPNKMYPLYQITYKNKPVSFKNDAEEIIRFAKDKSCKYLTFLITCVHMLTAEEIRILHREGEKICVSMKDLGIVVRLVFLCTCKETIDEPNVDWLFQFKPLNATESDLFLKKASMVLAKKNENLDPHENSDPYDEVKKEYSGRHLEAAENFARGNPNELYRFVEIILCGDKNLDMLNSVQNEWQKRCRRFDIKSEFGDKAADKEQLFSKRVWAILHLLIAFYREDVKDVPLDYLMSYIYPDLVKNEVDKNEVKKRLQEILGLREICLNPFSFKNISLSDTFCDQFLFSCGEFDKIPFHSEWQYVVGRLFTHEDLKDKDYAERYCSAIVNATIRCRLNHALPFYRNPSKLYQIIDKTILPVVFTGEMRSEAEERRMQICDKLREQCAGALSDFLADRLDVLSTKEVFIMISEDIDEYAPHIIPTIRVNVNSLSEATPIM